MHLFVLIHSLISQALTTFTAYSSHNSNSMNMVGRQFVGGMLIEV